MVRGFNRKTTNNMCLKVGLREAYDKISRKFIYQMLICLGFSENFARLKYECISIPTFSILIDGASIGFFSRNRGFDKEIIYLLYCFLSWWKLSLFY